MYDYNDYYNYGGTSYTDASVTSIFAIFGTLMWIMAIVSILMIVCMWVIFRKAGKKGWEAIIPVYNIIVLLEITRLPIWYIVLYLIPFANIYAMFKVNIELAHRFGKSTGFGVASVFFSIICMPILAFGKAQYDSNQASSDNAYTQQYNVNQNTLGMQPNNSEALISNSNVASPAVAPDATQQPQVQGINSNAQQANLAAMHTEIFQQDMNQNPSVMQSNNSVDPTVLNVATPAVTSGVMQQEQIQNVNPNVQPMNFEAVVPESVQQQASVSNGNVIQENTVNQADPMNSVSNLSDTGVLPINNSVSPLNELNSEPINYQNGSANQSTELYNNTLNTNTTVSNNSQFDSNQINNLNQASIKKCPNCGMQVTDKADSCFMCGHRF